MRDTGLNSRLQKFCSLLAASDGSETIVDLYVKAGFARDASNASSARKKLLAGGWLQAEREKLGLPPIEEEAVPTIDDEAQAALLEQARATYAMAVAAGDTKSAIKATRIIERALKPKRAPGRPTAQKPTQQHPAAPVGSGKPVSELLDLLLLPEDLAETEAAHPPGVEAAYATWRNGGSSEAYFAAAYGSMMKKSTLEDDTTVVDFEEPATQSLMSRAAPVALSAGEVVRRL